MTTNEAIAYYRTEKAIYEERRAARLAQASERLARLEALGNPFRRRHDPLRRKGAIDRQYDPADALWRSLKPYHGEERPR